MISRRMKIVLTALMIAVIVGGFVLRSLRRRVNRLAQTSATEEQARREVIAPPISTPTDVLVKAQIFWASATAPDKLEPVEVQLPLSADPAQRSKQVLQVLITRAPTPQQRTLPADTTLLDFYMLPDGTVIADFSDTLATETPSGILSEQLAVDSIRRTLEANVNALRRLKILIHGQEADTLAGHVDLSGFFNLNPPPPTATPAPATSAPTASGADAAGLTGPGAPGKLKP
jgi:hypothetical protein